MFRIALIYGCISGVIGIMSFVLAMMMADPENADFSGGQIVGYSVMLLALSAIFFGVRQYRNKELGGVIKFWKAFLVGLAITGVAGVFYVVGWEIYLAVTDHQFINQYIESMMKAKEAAGATAEELAKASAEMEKMRVNYANPFFRVPITFLEIMPVGLLVSLVSALLLRNSKFLPAKG